MSNQVIPFSDWSSIVSSFKNGVPVPFVHEIFLMECRIAGTTHVDRIETKTSSIAEGSLLYFLREPDNPVDKLAIRILNEREERIGYVPQAKNEVIARLMDGGKMIFGRVLSKDKRGNWIHIKVQVYLRDL
jgi:hypothetical protein